MAPEMNQTCTVFRTVFVGSTFDLLDAFYLVHDALTFRPSRLSTSDFQ